MNEGKLTAEQLHEMKGVIAQASSRVKPKTSKDIVDHLASCLDEALDAENADLRKRIEDVTTAYRTHSVWEIGALNQSVASYCDHCEGRANKAETEIAALKAALDVLCDAASAVISYEDFNYGGGNDYVILPLREALANARGGRMVAGNDETH